MNAQLMLIKQVLIRFDGEKVSYSLLRNHEFITDPTISRESIDMVISERSFNKAAVILTEMGFTPRTAQFSLRHKAFFTLVDLQLVSFDIQVGGVYWNDMAYLDESILQHRVKKDFFYVLSNNDAFVMLITHSILGKRYFKPKYKQLLQTLEVEESYVVKGLAFSFGEKNARRLFHLARKGELDKVRVFLLLCLFLFRNPLRFLTLGALTLRWVRWKKFLTLAPLISVVGPDGAGKSSMVEELREYLERQGRRVRVVYTGRGKGHFLPMSWIGRRYKWAEMKRDEHKRDEQHRQNSSSNNFSSQSSLSSKLSPTYSGESSQERIFVTNVSLLRRVVYLFMAPVFALDLYLRYLVYILPRRMRKRIVVTDRYCTDIVLMQHVPLFVKRGLYFLFPRPQFTIYLYNTPEVLHVRRPREPIEELRRQMNLFDRFTYSLRVQTSVPQKDVEYVLTEVFSYLLKNWY